MLHLIQKQTVEITISDVEEAKALQERIYMLCNSRLLVELDELFSSFSKRQKIRLEKLELDLGVLDVEDFERQFVEQLQIQLRKSLENSIFQSPDKNENAAPAVYTPSKEKNDQDILLYFLQYGTLPWWVAEAGSINLQDILNKVLAEDTPCFVDALHTLVSYHSVGRLVKQFHEVSYLAIVDEVLSRCTGSVVKTVDQWLQLLRITPPATVYTEELQTELLWFLFQDLPGMSSPDGVSEHLFAKVFGEEKGRYLEFAAFAKIGQRVLQPTSILSVWLEEKIQYIEKLKERKGSVNTKREGAEKERTSVSKRAVLSESSGQPQRETDNIIRIDGDEVSGHQQGRENRAPPDPGILEQDEVELVGEQWLSEGEMHYLENAGLVLLWPYLTRFFGRLDLLKDNQFIDAKAREKAVTLLQFLAVGGDNFSEHILLLNKVLCGWPLTVPLRKGIECTDDERRESEELLNSVILHWQALKKTSVDGLRHSFIQREGRLQQMENHWELKVARSGIDVLLDQLPWGISIIRLPWMAKTVYVEW